MGYTVGLRPCAACFVMGTPVRMVDVCRIKDERATGTAFSEASCVLAVPK